MAIKSPKPEESVAQSRQDVRRQHLWDRFEDLNNGGFLFHRGFQGAKMNKKSGTSKDAADKLVENLRRKTRQTYSPEAKNRIVLAGLRGGESTSVRCRPEGRAERVSYSWW